MFLTVGQLAKMTGITVRALHHYDARGVLVPSQRSEAGYRLYNQADIVRLYRIQALQRLGLSLADIAIALQHDGTSLPRLLSQQLVELDEQIARTTQLRDSLRRLETRLASSHEPEMSEWLRALELLATYDRYCSSEEIERLIANNNDADWPDFVRDVRSAMDRDIDFESPAAYDLARRWSRLVRARFGGDASLAKKMKLAYLAQPELQARVQAQSGFEPKMLEFCVAIATRAHVACWTRHLPAADLAQLRMTDEWGREWLPIAAEAKQVAASLDERSADARALLGKWDAALLAFAGGDATRKLEVESALRADSDLQDFWSTDSEVLDFVSRVKEMAS